MKAPDLIGYLPGHTFIDYKKAFYWILTVFTCLHIASCKSTKYTSSGIINLADTISYLPGTDPYNSKTFYKLKMTKGQFDSLRSFPGNRVIVQFFYPKASGGGSPTLFAYKMTVNHKPTGTPPVVLSYDSSTTEPLKGRGQVLGDQKVKIRDLEKLIKVSKGDKNASFSYLLFTPVFIPNNPHMTYEVRVDGEGEALTLNPSPPG